MSLDRPNVLLATVCRPFGGIGEGDSVEAELFHAQVTRSQGIFSYRQVIRCWALITPQKTSTLLAWFSTTPRNVNFFVNSEVANHDYIGINFVVATFHKLRPMVELIRKHSPRSQIFLGGYGTVLSDDELAPFGDLICREEGIGFIRRHLGEDRNRPIRHPYAPIESPKVFSYPLNPTSWKFWLWVGKTGDFHGATLVISST